MRLLNGLHVIFCEFEHLRDRFEHGQAACNRVLLRYGYGVPESRACMLGTAEVLQEHVAQVLDGCRVGATRRQARLEGAYLLLQDDFFKLACKAAGREPAGARWCRAAAAASSPVRAGRRAAPPRARVCRVAARPPAD